MIYNVFISTVQQSDSAIHIYILFHSLFHYGLSQDIGYSSLCYTVGPCHRTLLFIHPVYNSLHLLIPNSPSIPLPWKQEVLNGLLKKQFLGLKYLSMVTIKHVLWDKLKRPGSSSNVHLHNSHWLDA